VALYNLGLLHVDTKTNISTSSSATGASSTTSSAGGGMCSANKLNKGMSEESKQSLEKAAGYWRKLVDEVETGHVNGLRRLARLEMEQFNNPKAADKRYVAALQSLHQIVMKNQNQSPTSLASHKSNGSSNSGGGGGVVNKFTIELDGLISEVLSVMDKAPAKFDQSRILAEKLKRR
jgi:hypothetical protein